MTCKVILGVYIRLNFHEYDLSKHIIEINLRPQEKKTTLMLCDLWRNRERIARHMCVILYFSTNQQSGILWSVEAIIQVITESLK